MSATLQNKQCLLVKRPTGIPNEEHFKHVTQELSTELKPG